MASQRSPLTTSLSTEPTYDLGEPVLVTFEIENAGTDTYQLLTWGTPFEGELTVDCISLEKKLGMFVAPLVVAIAAGVLVPLLSGAFRGDNERPTGALRSEGLEVIDLTVGAGKPPELLADPRAPQLLDITVRNTGQVVSVITRATFRIRNFGLLRICQAGGGLEPTENYDVTLPPSPRPGELVEAKVSQQIRPNQADRFTFRLNVPLIPMQDGMRLYQLDVALLHDRDTRPLTAGTAVVSVPFIPTDDYFLSPGTDTSLYSPEVLGCYEENEKILRRFLNLEGERSPMLTKQLLPTD